MDFWMLKELNAQVLFDLREFVPKGHFVRENPFIINGVDISHDEKWGYLALALGERLLYESQAHLLTGSARQIAAIELLISLGMLASFEIKHPERPKALNDMLVSLRKYLNHMKKREAKPFVFLLESDPEQSEPQAVTTATNGESIWQDQARLIADKFFDADTDNGCRDSLKGYSKRVMDEMQKLEIHGARGRITESTYIMREALQAGKWWANKQK